MPRFLFVAIQTNWFNESALGCQTGTNIINMKERNVSIDLLKCLAALLITNSHMDLLYGKYSFLGTGGAIGDVLFFFCSGFTLFLKPMGGITYFPDWYKRRINRIYPTVLAVAILSCLLRDSHRDIIDIIIHGGGWFVSCIMLYYIAIFVIGAYMKNKIFIISLLVVIGSGIWFYSIYQMPDYQTPDFNMYGTAHYLRWLLFFIFMLLGAKMGTIVQNVKSNPTKDAILLMLNIIGFYAIYVLPRKFDSISALQFFSFLPLLGTVYYFYKVGASDWAKKLYQNKIGNFTIRFIGGLCLEIYLIQGFLFTDRMNNIFPLNIVIMFIMIFIAAYFTRCLSRFISQTFKDTPYDWGKIIELY